MVVPKIELTHFGLPKSLKVNNSPHAQMLIQMILDVGAIKHPPLRQ